jgi:hypothetical protein
MCVFMGSAATRNNEERQTGTCLRPGRFKWRWGRVEVPAWRSSQVDTGRRSRFFLPFVLPAWCHHSSCVVGVGVRIGVSWTLLVAHTGFDSGCLSLSTGVRPVCCRCGAHRLVRSSEYCSGSVEQLHRAAPRYHAPTRRRLQAGSMHRGPHGLQWRREPRLQDDARPTFVMLGTESATRAGE